MPILIQNVGQDKDLVGKRGFFRELIKTRINATAGKAIIKSLKEFVSDEEELVLYVWNKDKKKWIEEARLHGICSGQTDEALLEAALLKRTKEEDDDDQDPEDKEKKPKGGKRPAAAKKGKPSRKGKAKLKAIPGGGSEGSSAAGAQG